MKISFLIPVFFSLSSFCQSGGSYEEPSTNSDIVKVYNATEPPRYADGLRGLYLHIDENMRYPSEAKQKGIEGRVYLEVIISKSGEVIHAKVVKGLSDELNVEALRLINSFPKKYIPGLRKNEVVDTKIILPVKFDLVKYLSRER